MGLDERQIRQWEDDGFLILPSFFDDRPIEALHALHRRVWRERPHSVVVDGLTVGGRARMSELPEGDPQQPYKINDLYLNYEEMRAVALDPRLTAMLAGLIGDAPALCNTLSLDYGSQQENHVDSLYMTPPGESPLVATWTALEDCVPEAGPLVYVPGSHKIPPYRFSDGRMTEIPSEHDSWRQYIDGEVQRRGLAEQEFLPRRGDVLIWHGQLLHGGSKRTDDTQTRRSLVCHYFAADACRHAGYRLVEYGEAHWMKRPSQGASRLERTVEFVGRRWRQARR